MTRLWSKAEAIETWSKDGTPVGFVWQGTSHRIVQVCNRWRVHTWWWAPDQAVCREYLKVTTDSGYLCQLYHDLHAKQWFLARLYD